MATNQSVSKFQRVLAALPEVTRAQVRAEIFRQAHELAEAMRITVPRKEATLWRSIRVEPSSRSPLRAVVRAGGDTTTHPAPAGPYDYALANEFGTEKMAARPFIWPTYRQKRAGIRRAIKAEAVAAINKLVSLKGGP
jgi:HK97 gp10 family phage protein